MEEDVSTGAQNVPGVQEKWYTSLTRLTLLSKGFAMVLFIVLTFFGFWVGYNLQNPNIPTKPLEKSGRNSPLAVPSASDEQSTQSVQQVDKISSTSPTNNPPVYDSGKQVLLNGNVFGYILADGWQNGPGFYATGYAENQAYTFLKRTASFTDVDLQTEPVPGSQMFTKKALSVEDTPIELLGSHQKAQLTLMLGPVREALLVHLSTFPGIVEPLDPAMHIGQAWRIDLDGDGIDEELYNIYTLEPGFRKGDVGGKSNYALVALYHHNTPDKSATTTVLDTYVRRDDDSSYWPGFMGGATIDGFVDLNGDGTDEFIISDLGTESVSTRVFELQHLGPKVVLWTGGGA